MKFGFVSLGCSKNLSDSERVMSLILANDHQLVDDPKKAEVIIINTCGFINSAKEESINTILEMAEHKQDKCRYLVVIGCLVQRYLSDLKNSLPEVDRFITIDEYNDLPRIFTQLFEQDFHHYGKAQRVYATKPWIAYLKIAEGCNNRCSYCAIPLIRGSYRSISSDIIIEEAKMMALKGVKELVLIAQDTTYYGYDIDQKYHLHELLKELDKIEGFVWIRILYMYPDEIYPELIKTMKTSSKVLPYFDIPIQHGSDRMLKAMNRRGSVSDIMNMISIIRNTFAQPVLRTTLIVGYPNEKDSDHVDSLELIKKIGWDRLGAFTYSHEEDTPAYDLDDNIEDDLKQKRLDEIMRLQQEVVAKNNQRLINTHLQVLIEDHDQIKDYYRGRSIYSAPDGVDGIVYVRSDDKALKFGEFYLVRITEASAYDLKGYIVDN